MKKRRSKPLPAPAEWTFELIDTYFDAIGSTAARFGLDRFKAITLRAVATHITAMRPTKVHRKNHRVTLSRTFQKQSTRSARLLGMSINPGVDMRHRNL